MQKYISKARVQCWKIYEKYYDKLSYKKHSDRYRDAIIPFLTPDACLLDAGCGTEMEFTREFFPKVRMAVGLDIELLKRSTHDPYAVQSDLSRLPFKDSTFDIIITRSVLEHLFDPGTVFHEFEKLLKHNGVIVILTPNKYDYVSLIAIATPFKFHTWILSKLLDRTESDTFPTFFRANSRKKILHYLKRNSLIPLDVVLFNQYPAYLMFSTILFRIGILFEKITSRYNILANLRGWILIIAQK